MASAARANSWGSRLSMSSPVRPGCTMLVSPPTAAATTGVPHAAASRATRPNDSDRLGTRHHVGRPVVGRQQVVRLGVDPAHAVGHAQHLGELGGSGPARPRRRGRSGPPTASSTASGSLRTTSARAPMATSRPLSGCTRPTNSSTGVRPEVQGPPRAGAAAGREEGVVDARRHDLDPGGVGAVEAAELLGLGLGRGGDGVGAADDLGLGVDAVLRLEVARLGLGAGQGVEGGHQRQVELVLDAVARHARQPVVHVHRVGGVPQQVADHVVGELGDDALELLLRQVGRARVDVHHAEAGLDLDLVGQVGVPAPHVHLARHARLGQRCHQLTDVDVHPSAVPDARLDQGRRVEGDDRKGAHGGDQR